MNAKKLALLITSGLCTLMMVCPSWASEPTSATEPAKPYTFTGHFDLVSAYYLRGATTTYGNSAPGLGNAGADAPESSQPVLQWGADLVHESGWYAGYWGSRINYSYKRLGESYDDRTIVSGFQDNKSIENDIYGGYTAKVEDFSYTLGVTGYAYINGKYADGLETKFGAGYKAFGLNAQTLLNDTVWGNKGDTYWSLTYTTALPYELSFNASLGWYTYQKEGKYLGSSDTLSGTNCGAGTAFVVNGCYAALRKIRTELECAGHRRRREPLWHPSEQQRSGFR
jgi:uncharacterized protein (TIGR02001 family)